MALVFYDSHRAASQNALGNLEINEGFAWLHLRLPPPLNTDGPTSDDEQPVLEKVPLKSEIGTAVQQ